MTLVKTHITKKENAHKPDITISSDNVIITCKSACHECQFSIADELGRVLKKGILKDETTISFEGITPGFYHLIIFNEFERFRYPIKID